jgi:hypothetical protein
MLRDSGLKRELNGLIKAMKFFNKEKAIIVTFANSDYIEENGCKIEVIPAINIYWTIKMLHFNYIRSSFT